MIAVYLMPSPHWRGVWLHMILQLPAIAGEQDLSKHIRGTRERFLSGKLWFIITVIYGCRAKCMFVKCRKHLPSSAEGDWVKLREELAALQTQVRADSMVIIAGRRICDWRLRRSPYFSPQTAQCCSLLLVSIGSSSLQVSTFCNRAVSTSG